jgi:hypothetical protein
MRKSVHGFMQTHASEAEVRPLADTEDGFDRTTWQRARLLRGALGD